MPPPSKKPGGLSRFISGLRSRRSLVVEPGFPTSLADLVVKNRSRLRKKPQNTPPPPRHPSPAPALVPAAVPVDEPVPEVAVAVVEIGEDVLDEHGVLIKRGFSLLIAEMFALVMLTVGEKRLVFRLTVAAFVFVVVDVLGIRVVEMLTPCSEVKGGGEIVLPIKEVVSRSVSLSTDYSGSSESGELTEMREIGVMEKGSRRRRMWKKLVPKKLRSKQAQQDCIDTTDMLGLGSAGWTVCDGDEEAMREEENGENDEGEAPLSGEICNVVELHNDSGVVQSGERNDCHTRSMRSRKLLLIIVLLFGLAGGRIAALAVTVAWFMLSTSIDKLWRKSRLRRVC